jgi:hypothetical protein
MFLGAGFTALTIGLPDKTFLTRLPALFLLICRSLLLRSRARLIKQHDSAAQFMADSTYDFADRQRLPEPAQQLTKCSIQALVTFLQGTALV